MKGLVVYCSTGEGFKSPAMAIGKALRSRGHEIEYADFYRDIDAETAHGMLVNGWRAMLARPFLFRILFRFTDSWFIHVFHFAVAFFLSRKFRRYIEGVNPDFVLSTHYSSTIVMGALLPSWRARAGKAVPLFGYNSDVILSHKAYITNRARRYFVSTRRGMSAMLAHGIKPGMVRLVEFPLGDNFIKKFSGVAAERAALGLSDRFTVLVSLGGEGIGDLSFIEELAARALPIQVVVICGRNEALARHLETMVPRLAPLELRVRGFVANMQDYLYCCDISSGKCGLNTVFESIAYRKPFLALMAMANERIAADFVRDEGFGAWPENTSGAADFVESALGDPDILRRMRERMEASSYRFGTGGIVDIIEKECASVCRTGGGSE